MMTFRRGVPRRLRLGLIGFTALVFSGLARAAQDAPRPQGQAFRVGVDLVSVDVSVLDSDRHPVEGLTAADFTVLEDGKPRPVEAFAAVTLPTRVTPTAPWMLDVSPDVTTNVMPAEGRLVMILFDHTIGPELNQAVRKIARAAVEALGPGDVAAILHTELGSPQGFTADRGLLEAAIDRPFMGLSTGDEGNQGQCRCGICSLEAMTLLADSVRDLARRRKTLLFIGTRLPIERGDICDGVIRPAREALVRATQAANMTIDALDPSWLNTLASMADPAGTPHVEPGNGSAGAVITAARAEMERQGTLGTYADYTGGRFVVNTNAPDGAQSRRSA